MLLPPQEHVASSLTMTEMEIYNYKKQHEAIPHPLLYFLPPFRNIISDYPFASLRNQDSCR
jgi:hypothetical protein